MPINGLSEKRRLPRLGKIHLGVKDTNAKGVEYPRAVDYFVVPDEIKEVYGEKPTELDIMIPTEDPNIFFPQFYKQYSNKRGLVCKGDGTNANRVGEDGEMVELTCNPATCEFYLKGDCKPVGNLLFVLPKVKGFGVYQVDTSSLHNIINLNSEIALLKNLLGRVSGIPLKLTREVQKVQQKGVMRNLALIHIRSPYSLSELQNSKKALGAPESVSIEVPDNDIPESVPEEIEEDPHDEVQPEPLPEEKPEPKPEPIPEPLYAEKLINEILIMLKRQGYTSISKTIPLLEKAIPEHSWKKVDSTALRKMSPGYLQRILNTLKEQEKEREEAYS